MNADQHKVERGRAIVQEKCSDCHSVTSQDPSPHRQAPSLTHLSKSYPVAQLAEALAEGIMSGHPDMPVFEFGAQSVEDIITYLEGIQDQ